MTVWAGLAVVLLAVVLPVLPAPAPADPAAASPETAASAKSVPAAAAATPAASSGGGGGPACGPGSPDHGGLPAVPARAVSEHGQLPAGRPVPEEARPHGAMPVRVLVRGPDRPAPGPVELSVMRV
ncbi:hypothetical protein [Streptomyces sp. NPDC059949]|uniref:hypothetical protein n=1 Tax=Streptomyces sp. NPDC059949 TaxID=3347013 RepID=UPI00365177F2